MIDWDRWRQAHASLTFADQQAFYEKVAVAHPEQRSFNPASAGAAFDYIAGENLVVLELGGWDGYLASLMLERGDIFSWTNYDIVAVPQACSHPCYRLVVLEDYFWNQPQARADVFVACHTIEHLTTAELAKLFNVLRTPYVYLEAPLPDVGSTNWAGYAGSHILELSWVQVDEFLQEHGYKWQMTNLWQHL